MLMRKCLLAMLILMLVILMLILMLLNLNTGMLILMLIYVSELCPCAVTQVNTILTVSLCDVYMNVYINKI